MSIDFKKILSFAFVGIMALCIMAPVGKASATTSGSSVYLPNGKYYLRNKNSKYMRMNGTNIDVSYEGGWQENEFYLEKGRDGFYTIRHVWSGKNIDVAGASTKAGANVGLWENNGTCAQKWALDDDGQGYYVFRNACSGLVLDVAGGSSAAGANVQVWNSNGTNAQKWALSRNEELMVDKIDFSKSWNIKSRAGTGEMLYMDIAGGHTANGTNLQIWSRNYTAAQLFKLEKNSDGSVRIKYPKANKSLDVSGGARYNGANVAIWENNNTCAQKWFVEWSWTHDTYRFLNACSGLALDVTGDNASLGVNVQIWEANDTNAQEWYLVKRW